MKKAIKRIPTPSVDYADTSCARSISSDWHKIRVAFEKGYEYAMQQRSRTPIKNAKDKK